MSLLANAAFRRHGRRRRLCSCRLALDTPLPRWHPVRCVDTSRTQLLLQSYGISLDKEAEARDRVRHTAARVGLLVREADFSFTERDAQRDAQRDSS